MVQLKPREIHITAKYISTDDLPTLSNGLPALVPDLGLLINTTRFSWPLSLSAHLIFVSVAQIVLARAP